MDPFICLIYYTFIASSICAGENIVLLLGLQAFCGNFQMLL